MVNYYNVKMIEGIHLKNVLFSNFINKVIDISIIIENMTRN